MSLKMQEKINILNPDYFPFCRQSTRTRVQELYFAGSSKNQSSVKKLGKLRKQRKPKQLNAWSPERQAGYQNCSNYLANRPLLAFPTYSHPHFSYQRNPPELPRGGDWIVGETTLALSSVFSVELRCPDIRDSIFIFFLPCPAQGSNPSILFQGSSITL